MHSFGMLFTSSRPSDRSISRSKSLFQGVILLISFCPTWDEILRLSPIHPELVVVVNVNFGPIFV